MNTWRQMRNRLSSLSRLNRSSKTPSRGATRSMGYGGHGVDGVGVGLPVAPRNKVENKGEACTTCNEICPVPINSQVMRAHLGPPPKNEPYRRGGDRWTSNQSSKTPSRGATRFAPTEISIFTPTEIYVFSPTEISLFSPTEILFFSPTEISF